MAETEAEGEGGREVSDFHDAASRATGGWKLSELSARRMAKVESAMEAGMLSGDIHQGLVDAFRLMQAIPEMVDRVNEILRESGVDPDTLAPIQEQKTE